MSPSFRRHAALPLGNVALLLLAMSLAALKAAEQAAGAAKGPLRAHPNNPHYFTDGTGKAIYLTGSHTWNTLQDWGTNDTIQPLDFKAFVKMLVANHHNFTLI